MLKQVKKIAFFSTQHENCLTQRLEIFNVCKSRYIPKVIPHTHISLLHLFWVIERLAWQFWKRHLFCTRPEFSSNYCFCFVVDSFRCGAGTTKINNQPAVGSFLNFFPQIKFNCDGYLSKMAFNALRAYDFYLGFWEQVAGTANFRLLSKRKITANSTGVQVRFQKIK